MSGKGKATAAMIRLVIPAGKATPSPPIGPALGQRGVKAIDFCKQFNEVTKVYQPETPMRVRIDVNPDKTFKFAVRTPTTTHFLLKAAGIEKGSGSTGHEVAGKISLKHIYEIAKIKQHDENLRHLPLRSICRMLIATSNTMGVLVVP
ncbi:ribosomal protein L11 [Ramicandelaber brevisporus]|nr:ribosomal protein L11 [Ramicandelaber brevisporus]